MSTHSTIARAPADRAPGDRGPRGRVAAVLVVGAVLAVAMIRLRGHGSGGGGGGGGSAWQFQYSYLSPGWSTLGFVVAAAALVSAGTILWVATAKRLVALAAVLAIAGAGMGVWTIATPNDIRISPAAFRAIRLGTEQTVITSRLGKPFSTDASATSSRGGGALGCLLYQFPPQPQPASGTAVDVPSGAAGASIALFCFDHGRLRVKSAM